MPSRSCRLAPPTEVQGRPSVLDIFLDLPTLECKEDHMCSTSSYLPGCLLSSSASAPPTLEDEEDH
eukprot:14571696-Heterocapsa_arctica.AAC.1